MTVKLTTYHYPLSPHARRVAGLRGSFLRFPQQAIMNKTWGPQAMLNTRVAFDARCTPTITYIRTCSSSKESWTCACRACACACVRVRTRIISFHLTRCLYARCARGCRAAKNSATLWPRAARAKGPGQGNHQSYNYRLDKLGL